MIVLLESAQRTPVVESGNRVELSGNHMSLESPVVEAGLDTRHTISRFNNWSSLTTCDFQIPQLEFIAE